MLGCGFGKYLDIKVFAPTLLNSLFHVLFKLHACIKLY